MRWFIMNYSLYMFIFLLCHHVEMSGYKLEEENDIKKDTVVVSATEEGYVADNQLLWPLKKAVEIICHLSNYF